LVRYPDGSLFAEGTVRTEEFSQVLGQERSYGVIAQRHFFRALAPFSEMAYRLDFPKAYYESLMPMPFVVGNFLGNPPTPSEFKLAQLALTTGFLRRPRKAVMERFAVMVHDWYASVREHGLLGDGPIARLWPEVEFDGLRAQFRVDARLAGQHTLNWFFLKALDFGMEVFPICAVAVADEELLEGWFGPSRGKITAVPIRPGKNAPSLADAGPAEENAVPVHLPPDCTPYTELASELRLFQRPIFEWDALHVTVYFTVFPTPEEQKEFGKLIEAWGTMGYYGGLGGGGIHCLREMTFSDKAESAHFYADMGNTDYPGAFAVLIRLLENFSKSVLAIEAVVFGTGPTGMEESV
jgi:hypothetical protein